MRRRLIYRAKETAVRVWEAEQLQFLRQSTREKGTELTRKRMPEIYTQLSKSELNSKIPYDWSKSNYNEKSKYLGAIG